MYIGPEELISSFYNRVKEAGRDRGETGSRSPMKRTVTFIIEYLSLSVFRNLIKTLMVSLFWMLPSRKNFSFLKRSFGEKN
jgi:hypothetical protein